MAIAQSAVRVLPADTHCSLPTPPHRIAAQAATPSQLGLFGRWLFTALFALLATGCTSATQPNVVDWMPLVDRIGQTFVSDYAGLQGVEIFLTPLGETAGSGTEEIVLHLRGEPDAETDIATATLPLAAITEPAFYRFTFDAQPDSRRRFYYAEWEVPTPDAVLLARAPGALYLGGALYLNGLAQEGQMAFRLVYAPAPLVWDLLQRLGMYAGILALAALLYIVPGLALLLLAEGARAQPITDHWAERVALAAGISLALYPLLMLWTYSAGLALGWAYAWLPMMLGLVGLGWHVARHMRRLAPGRWLPVLYAPSLLPGWRSGDAQATLCLLLIMGLVCGTRLLAVRTLVAPSWGDAVQHGAITQLMLDHGGLFQSWQPYASYETLSVHFGFPALSAVFHWAQAPLLRMLGVDGLWLDSAYSVLIAGQLVNSLAVLTIYPLAVRMAGGRRWAGVGAVLVAGLLSLTPGTYVNWGRYAQLAGQAILPVALWLMWRSAETAAWHWRQLPVWLLAGIALAGAALGHYRMPLFYTLFAVAWLVVWAVPHWRLSWGGWARAALALGTVASVAAISLAPWLLQIRSSRLAQLASTATSETVKLKWLLIDMQTWRALLLYVPHYLLALAAVALLWAIWRRKGAVLLAGAWALLLPTYKAGQLLALPGAHMMESFATIIYLYIPISVLVGWLLVELYQALTARHLLYRVLLIVLVCGGALWGVQRQIGIVQPSFVMVTPPDRRAMEWIEQNTRPDALFLVEGYQVVGAAVTTVGADAGWWLPIYTGRANTVPPQYAILNERPDPPDYTQRVVDLVGNLAGLDPATPEATALFCQNGITHIYVGQQQGMVGFGVRQLFAPQALAANPDLALPYHQDRVYIFALRSDACGPTP